MKQIFTLLLFFGAITNLFSQELKNQQIENDLYNSYQKIVSLQFAEYGAQYNLLAFANNQFADKVKEYTSVFPTTLTSKFDSLRKNISITDSEDQLMRIFSWDTMLGGSGRSFANVFQYKVGKKVFSKVAYNKPYFDDDWHVDSKKYSNLPFYSQIFTLKTANKTYYLGINNNIYSGKYGGQSIKILTIDGNNLNDSIALIKTKNGLVNQIEFNYNFFNISDRPERPFQLIKYDSKQKIIYIPTQDSEGNLSDNFILYKFTGNYFELLETAENNKINLLLDQESLFVKAENGLIIRTSPDKKSQRIGKFDYAEEIKLYRKTGKYINIIDAGKNISGEWYEVSGFNLNEPDQIGYVFSGLLTSDSLNKNSKLKFENLIVEFELDGYDVLSHINAGLYLGLDSPGALENKIIKIKTKKIKKIELLQGFQNTIAIYSEGKSCALYDWKQYYSEWKTIPFIQKENGFKILNYFDEEKFIPVTIKELQNALDESCSFAPFISSIKDVDISTSAIIIKIIITNNDGSISEKTIKYWVNIGC